MKTFCKLFGGSFETRVKNSKTENEKEAVEAVEAEPNCLQYPSLGVPTRGADPEVAAGRAPIVCHVCSMFPQVFNAFVFRTLLNVCVQQCCVRLSSAFLFVFRFAKFFYNSYECV